MEAGMNLFLTAGMTGIRTGAVQAAMVVEIQEALNSGNNWNTSNSSNTRPKPSGNDWGTRPPVGGGPSGSGGYDTGEKDVYIIRGIAENPLRGMGGFAKNVQRNT